MIYVLFLSIDTPIIRLFLTASFQFEKELLGRLSRTMHLAGPFTHDERRPWLTERVLSIPRNNIGVCRLTY